MKQVRRRILDEHRETVAAVLNAGAAVASAVQGWPVTDPDRIRRPLGECLEKRGLSAPLLDMLATGVDALETEIRGNPVAAPPYFVVTSRGPICRGTLANEGRLLVELVVFAVERQPPRYRFRDPAVNECLQVRLC